MTEDELVSHITREPFMPFRLHLVSGKTVDVFEPNAAHTLAHALVLFRNPIPGTPRAESYDVIAYHNIERIELLDVGKRPNLKRKRA